MLFWKQNELIKYFVQPFKDTMITLLLLEVLLAKIFMCLDQVQLTGKCSNSSATFPSTEVFKDPVVESLPPSVSIQRQDAGSASLRGRHNFTKSLNKSIGQELTFAQSSRVK